MRILILGDINSAHVKKWCLGLVSYHVEVAVFSLTENRNETQEFPFQVFSMKKKTPSSDLKKMFYLLYYNQLRRVVSSYKPDIVHAHYATSYGLLGTLLRYHPFLISVWGSDVMSFPNKSFLHRYILNYILNNADKIFATSKILNTLTRKYTHSSVSIIPFGVKTDLFKYSALLNNKKVVIGTVKSLEEVYGIDILIRAFAQSMKLTDEYDLELRIVGDGSQKDALIELVNSLGINDSVIFYGRVDYEDIYIAHKEIDIFVNVSRQESFGVSVLEASATGRPVIATNTGGLKEVVLDGETGILVPVNDITATSKAIINLVKDFQLRQRMGQKGNSFVLSQYNWENNIASAISEYNKLIIN